MIADLGVGRMELGRKRKDLALFSRFFRGLDRESVLFVHWSRWQISVNFDGGLLSLVSFNQTFHGSSDQVCCRFLFVSP